MLTERTNFFASLMGKFVTLFRESCILPYLMDIECYMVLGLEEEHIVHHLKLLNYIYIYHDYPINI